jgi:hypothetical protein
LKEKYGLGPHMVCRAEPVPKGYVVVGYNSSAKCGENSALVIRKPRQRKGSTMAALKLLILMGRLVGLEPTTS